MFVMKLSSLCVKLYFNFDDVTPFDCKLIRSKVKVTMVTFVKNGFCSFFFYHRAFIFHMVVGLSEDMNTIEKVKVTRVT